MASPPKTLSALLAKTEITDHEEILRTCTTSLKTSKPDLETQHIRLVALLKLDRYNDALRVLEEAGPTLKAKAKLERAYALYKTGELEEARAIVREVGDERGARHVEAQAVSSFLNIAGSEWRLTLDTTVIPLGRLRQRGGDLQETAADGRCFYYQGRGKRFEDQQWGDGCTIRVE